MAQRLAEPTEHAYTDLWIISWIIWIISTENSFEMYCARTTGRICDDFEDKTEPNLLLVKTARNWNRNADVRFSIAVLCHSPLGETQTLLISTRVLVSLNVFYASRTLHSRL